MLVCKNIAAVIPNQDKDNPWKVGFQYYTVSCFVAACDENCSKMRSCCQTAQMQRTTISYAFLESPNEKEILDSGTFKAYLPVNVS